MAYANFQGLIDSLHSGVSDTVEEEKNIIEINEKRQFTPKDFDTIIAYEGDINSQIITFKSIRYSDNHDLYACEYHIIKWKNLASGVEGKTNLALPSTIPEGQNYFYATWEVPPELCTQTGTIEISISYYDENNSFVVYSWNTPPYTGLTVGKSMDSVSSYFPAKNEILVINKETKAILAPMGYNNIICNYGDVGVANVYFLIDRYLGKDKSFDVFNSELTLYIIINGYRKKDNINLTKVLYTEEFNNRQDGLVLISWAVPAEITTNENYGSGKFELTLEIVKKEGENIVKRWFSNSYSNLEIGRSIIQIEDTPNSGVTEETIYRIIDQYFEIQDIVFDSNE